MDSAPISVARVRCLLGRSCSFLQRLAPKRAIAFVIPDVTRTSGTPGLVPISPAAKDSAEVEALGGRPPGYLRPPCGARMKYNSLRRFMPTVAEVLAVDPDSAAAIGHWVERVVHPGTASTRSGQSTRLLYADEKAVSAGEVRARVLSVLARTLRAQGCDAFTRIQPVPWSALRGCSLSFSEFDPQVPTASPVMQASAFWRGLRVD